MNLEVLGPIFNDIRDEARKKLIEEFFEDIDGYLNTDVDDAIGYFLKIREKWEKRHAIYSR